MSQQRDQVEIAIADLEATLAVFWEKTLDGVTTGDQEAQHIAETVRWMFTAADIDVRLRAERIQARLQLNERKPL